MIIPEAEAWALGWHGRLTAAVKSTISSPALRGRPGAGYGGLFCRLIPADSAEVLTAAADTEAGAHGSRSPWLAPGHGDLPTASRATQQHSTSRTAARAISAKELASCPVPLPAPR